MKLNRRSLLKLAMGAVVAPPVARSPLRVVVAGAGIVGASIAYQLAKAGASVTVLDRLGPAAQASGATFAWINASWTKTPRHYHALSQAGVAGWRALQSELQLPVRWGGSLEWFAQPDRQRELEAQIAAQRDWGDRTRMVSASTLAELEPQADFSGAEQAAFAEDDGAVDAQRATQVMLTAARKMGAKIRYPCELSGVALKSGRLTAVDTTRGSLKADRLVLATGAAPDTARRFADIELPQRSTPGIIAITAPLPRVLNRVLVAPGVHLHQRDDGRIVIGEQEGPPQNEAHAARLQQRPGVFPAPDIAEQHAMRMLEVAKRYLPPMRSARIDSVRIGWRPLPLDGFPVLGASPSRGDIYLAVMHSGVTLAPIVGQLVAQELADGMLADRLQDFRPGRSFAASGQH